MATAAAGEEQEQYWCHQCSRIVETRMNTESEEVECVSCNGPFVEAIEDENDQEDHPERFTQQESDQGSTNNASNVPQALGPLVAQLLSQMTATTTTAGSTATTESTTATTPPTANATSNEEMNPQSIFRNMIQQLANGQGNDGRSVEVNMTDPSSMGMAFPFPMIAGNLGDYAFGNINTIINQLMTQDQSANGTPPAAKSVVEKLPTITVEEAHLEANPDCAVCKEDFQTGDPSKKLPCQHMFHPDCILPWLEQRNSCPVCRHELPTDDEDYERRRSTQAADINTSNS